MSDISATSANNVNDNTGELNQISDEMTWDTVDEECF
jgi:hypothetical protein